MPSTVSRLAFVHSFFSNSEVHGAALLLSGEAGVGKTAVFDAVAGPRARLDAGCATGLSSPGGRA
ncbi:MULTISPECIES: hypothetical protein [unclassified Streptomyces]|uniref:hypothetical protein n=1 Tax=unclassified Streptomyces TaxID=2593676 RepID=UPI0036EC5A4F